MEYRQTRNSLATPYRFWNLLQPVRITGETPTDTDKAGSYGQSTRGTTKGKTKDTTSEKDNTTTTKKKKNVDYNYMDTGHTSKWTKQSESWTR